MVVVSVRRNGGGKGGDVLDEAVGFDDDDVLADDDLIDGGGGELFLGGVVEGLEPPTVQIGMSLALALPLRVTTAR